MKCHCSHNSHWSLKLRETGEAGRPAVLTKEGALRSDGIGETFKNLAESLMRLPQ